MKKYLSILLLCTILLGLLAVVIDGFRADKRCAQRVDEPGEQGEEG